MNTIKVYKSDFCGIAGVLSSKTKRTSKRKLKKLISKRLNDAMNASVVSISFKKPIASHF